MATRLTNEEAIELHVDHRIVQWHYPWDEWLDGSWWLIEKGKDYFIKTKSMRKLIYDKKKHGEQGVITHVIAEDTILFKRREAYVSDTRA
jgi:hypothetical protein